MSMPAAFGRLLHRGFLAGRRTATAPRPPAPRPFSTAGVAESDEIRRYNRWLRYSRYLLGLFIFSTGLIVGQRGTIWMEAYTDGLYGSEANRPEPCGPSKNY